MSPRGRPAQQPDSFVSVPDRLASPTLLRATSDTGKPIGELDFSALPVAHRVQAELAEGFSHLVHGGPWRSPTTVQNGWTSCARFARWLSQEEPTLASLTDLKLSVWHRWWLFLPPDSRRTYGRMAQRVLLEVPGLPADLTDALQYTRLPPRPESTTDALTSPQAAVVVRRATSEIRAASLRIAAGWQIVTRLRSEDPSLTGDDRLRAEVLRELADGGPLPRERHTRRLEGEVARAFGSTEGVDVFRHLFLTNSEAVAAICLLMVNEGFNLSVAQGLKAADVVRNDAQDASEPAIVSAAIEKARRPQRFDAVSSVGVGRRSTAEALLQVRGATDPARDYLSRHGIAEPKLIVCLWAAMYGWHGPTEAPLFAFPAGSPVTWTRALTRWQLGFAADDVPRFTAQMLRNFFVTTRHSQGHGEVQNSKYKLRNKQVRAAAKPAIAIGIEDAWSTSRQGPRVQLEAEPTEPRAAELETPTAICTDYDHSPFNNGNVCTATFLLCLACPLAVVTRRHLARLVHLHDRLTTLRGATSESEWSMYRLHWERVSDLLNRHFSPVEQASARRSLQAWEREQVDFLFDNRFRT